MKFKLDGKAFLTAKDKIKFCILEGKDVAIRS
jgi:hypothetical protein